MVNVNEEVDIVCFFRHFNNWSNVFGRFHNIEPLKSTKPNKLNPFIMQTLEDLKQNISDNYLSSIPNPDFMAKPVLLTKPKFPNLWKKPSKR